MTQADVQFATTTSIATVKSFSPSTQGTHVWHPSMFRSLTFPLLPAILTNQHK